MSRVLDTTVLIGRAKWASPGDGVPPGPRHASCLLGSRGYEVIRGLRTHERRLAERLFREVRWFPLDEAIARSAGELGRRLRKSHGAISVADLVIAATADRLGLLPATTNVRHFPLSKGLRAPHSD